MAVVLHHSAAKGTDKLVLLGIANHAGDGGAWPSVSTLARYANVHERNVQKAIDRLVSAGELARYVQDGGTARMRDHDRPNRYEVLVTCPATCDRTWAHRVRALPTAAAGLWTEGVAVAPPGGGSATPGVAQTTPRGVAAAPPEPSIEPSMNHGVSVVGNHRTRACAVCSLDEQECQRRAATSGHTFTPKAGAA